MKGNIQRKKPSIKNVDEKEEEFFVKGPQSASIRHNSQLIREKRGINSGLSNNTRRDRERERELITVLFLKKKIMTQVEGPG